MKKVKGILCGVLIIVLLVVIVNFIRQKDKEIVIPEFKGFMDASIYVAEFEEIVQGAERLVEVRITKLLNNDEASKLKGESEYMLVSNTYFEAEILNDYYDSTKKGEKIYIAQEGTYEWQLRGNPMFEVGQKFIMFLVKNNPEDQVWGPFIGGNSIFDVIEENDDIFLFKRFGDIPCESLIITEDNINYLNENKDNPAFYNKKISLSNLLELLKGYGINIESTLEE